MGWKKNIEKFVFVSFFVKSYGVSGWVVDIIVFISLKLVSGISLKESV